MAERAPEAVELPDHQDVACAEMGEHLLRDWALDPCPADDLFIDLLAPGLAQRIELEGETLVLCAHMSDPMCIAGPLEFGILVVFSS